jgi:hypothetical protein
MEKDLGLFRTSFRYLVLINESAEEIHKYLINKPGG